MPSSALQPPGKSGAGRQRPSDPHGSGIVVDGDTLPRTESDQTQEHDFCERRGVGERRGRGGLATTSIDPVHLVAPFDAFVPRRYRGGLFFQLLWEEPGIAPIGLVHEQPSFTDEDDAAHPLQRHVVG
jgi:hypothetical protein